MYKRVDELFYPKRDVFLRASLVANAMKKMALPAGLTKKTGQGWHASHQTSISSQAGGGGLEFCSERLADISEPSSSEDSHSESSVNEGSDCGQVNLEDGEISGGDDRPVDGPDSDADCSVEHGHAGHPALDADRHADAQDGDGLQVDNHVLVVQPTNGPVSLHFTSFLSLRFFIFQYVLNSNKSERCIL